MHPDDVFMNAIAEKETFYLVIEHERGHDTVRFEKYLDWSRSLLEDQVHEFMHELYTNSFINFDSYNDPENPIQVYLATNHVYRSSLLSEEQFIKKYQVKKTLKPAPATPRSSL